MNKHILFVTATRADFGKLKPLIDKVKSAPEFDYDIFITGMHMLAKYGATATEVSRAGFEHSYRYINQDASVDTQMDLVLANTIQGLGHYVREFPPDLLVVHGDRVETLAGAIVGSLGGTLVAHVEGGEVSGTVDELLRHAVTKLSHLHFVANGEARSRLVQMGEAPSAVLVIGSPDIDVMLSGSLPSLADVRDHYEIPYERYCIVMYHPVTTELPVIKEHAAVLARALSRSGRNLVVIHPNNDTGSETVMSALGTLREPAHARFIPSMRFEYFLTLLRHADAIVGNSSAGVREAPVYGVPTVNVGSRQLNRHRSPSIVDVPEDEQTLVDALATLPAHSPPSSHFGDGNSAARFLEALRSPALWTQPRQKQFRDVVDSATEWAEPDLS